MTENELLSELVKELYLPPREDGDVDPSQLARKVGLTRRRADEILKEKAENGELQRVQVRDYNTGRALWVYRKIE